MSDDLGKYLDNLGISPADEAEESLLPEAFEESDEVGESGPEPVPDLLDRSGDTVERTESFLVALLMNFGPAYSAAVRQDEETGEIQVQISGGEPGKLIGRGGRTLQALEYLVNAVVNRDDQGAPRIFIDVGDFKRRRDDRLRQLASRSSDTVRKTGEALELEPMSAAERRIIHMALADVPGISTESTGDARDRRVVIIPD